MSFTGIIVVKVMGVRRGAVPLPHLLAPPQCLASPHQAS